MAQITSFEDLAMEGLRAIYSAENQALAAYPQMMQAATSPDLQQAFQMHMTQTQNQVQRLEQIFTQMSQSPEGMTCEITQAMIATAQKKMNMVEGGPLLDAVLIASAQQMEHFEIASYGTAATFAKQMGDSKAASLLAQTLQEEKDTDEKLTQIAEANVNQKAAQA